MSNALTSIIILNWNGKKTTEECLNSLMPQLNKNFETILVDSASTDGSAKYLRRKFPKLKIIQSKKNLGYAGGNNLGVKNAKGNYILILNNDVVLDKNFLKEIYKNKNKADILGVKNYYYDKKDILWSVGSKINSLTMRASLIGNKEKDSGQYDKNFSPPQIVGSAMLINKKVIDKIGFLNDDYFAYCEETEWQTRALNNGFTVSWIPAAKLWHKVGFSTGGARSPVSSYYLTRNRAYFIEKWAKYKLIAWSYWTVEVIARICYGVLIGKKEFSVMTYRGVVDFLKRKSGKLK